MSVITIKLVPKSAQRFRASRDSTTINKLKFNHHLEKRRVASQSSLSGCPTPETLRIKIVITKNSKELRNYSKRERLNSKNSKTPRDQSL